MSIKRIYADTSIPEIETTNDADNITIAHAVFTDRKCAHLRAFTDAYMDSPVVLLGLDFSDPDEVVGACVVCDLPLTVRDLDPTRGADDALN